MAERQETRGQEAFPRDAERQDSAQSTHSSEPQQTVAKGGLRSFPLPIDRSDLHRLRGCRAGERRYPRAYDCGLVGRRRPAPRPKWGPTSKDIFPYGSYSRLQCLYPMRQLHRRSNPTRRGDVVLEARSSNRWISVTPTSTEIPMTANFRFGRRIPLPSTAQILHELKVLSAQEEGRKRYALADGLPETASWEEIGAHRARAERKAASAAADAPD